jgi:hypothetical protein
MNTIFKMANCYNKNRVQRFLTKHEKLYIFIFIEASRQKSLDTVYNGYRLIAQG